MLPRLSSHIDRISTSLRKECRGKAAQRRKNPRLDHVQHLQWFQQSLEHLHPDDGGRYRLSRVERLRGKLCRYR